MTNLLRKAGVASLGLLCLGWLLAAPATASTFLAMDHEELITHSDAVIQGKVLRVESYWDITGRVIISEAEILVDETIAGRGMEGFLTVQTFGGQVGDFHVEASGFPRFQEGDRVVLFLNRREAKDGAIRVTGYQLGEYRILDQAGTAMAVPTVEPGVRFLRDGQPVEPPQALPLAELKTRLRRIENRLLQQAQ